jgi:magnesium-protoporphyrin O-methyltransferase
MDSLIHYRASDLALALGRLAPRARRSILFTFAPRTPALAAMHAVGRIFPRAARAPAVEPVAEGDLRRRLAAEPALAGWRIGRQRRVSRGFYISQACELVRG